MEDDATQPATQPMMDARRVGKNNSELDDEDRSNIVAILTPTTPAAYRTVEETASSRPEHVYFPYQYGSFENQSVDVEEQETIIIDRPDLGSSNLYKTGHSLALRMSSRLKKDSLGFVFGRNNITSDIVFGQDSAKRISNQHFRIYLNADMVVMIEDMSTNGTIVDNILLRSRDIRCTKQRMLNSNSTIRVQSSNDPDFIEYSVKIPSRVSHAEEFQRNVRAFLTRCATTDDDFKAIQRLGNNFLGSTRAHWDGSPNYNMIRELGKGAFATVHLLATKMEGKLVAAKEIKTRDFLKNDQWNKKLDNELKIMKDLHHNNIVQYIDNVRTNDHIYIIMEFVRYGDLATLWRQNGNINEMDATILARQMLDALRYLHGRKIAHRDIKPDNILISEKHPNYLFKLADFGLSKDVRGTTFLTTFCGTLMYCAPEVFPEGNQHGVKRRRGQKPTKDLYDSKVDIYSLAAVLWHVMAGSPPVPPVADNGGHGMFRSIMATTLDATPLREKGIAESCIELLCSMLQKDPFGRPTASECLRKDWVRDGDAVLSQDYELGRIEEESDSEEADSKEADPQEADAQFSQLSIYDVDDAIGNDVLDDGIFGQMVDVRQSKRIRMDPSDPRHQLRDQEQVSSAENSLQSHRFTENENGESPPAIPSGDNPGRLFGEIGRSALKSSAILNVHANAALSQIASDNGVVPDSVYPNSALAASHPDAQRDAAFASPSLFGAEAMVRDMNMESPQSPASIAQTPNEPATPKTPDVPQHSSLEHHSQQASQFSDATPKAKPALNRQISLPKTPSFFYDPFDPNTHNLEYASKVSGLDFVSASGPGKSDGIPLPDTAHVSTVNAHVTQEPQSATAPAHSTLPPELDIRPPPRRLGKLTASSDSFAPLLVLPIDKNRTSWGRVKENDLVYEQRSDTRVPKTAFTIFWHSPDRESIDQLSQEGKDWTTLRNVHVGIVTGATSGITVNGKLLRKTDGKGNYLYGWLHTGDVIQVYQDARGSECLKFRCEFYFGTGKEPRPLGKSFNVRIHSQLENA
ncbi:kinase-like protein [Lophiostoma macrostomum CBS 122681]|uniref:Autophagy-related protein 1 n=1 Tax=Lophiostoma macrostomum CBS 122681 TaxID=1314788 RepID=A0A6A6TSI1_9PLEO|nr:kinase-like protein [Lophiostoma macrostomum CBS 122681]